MAKSSSTNKQQPRRGSQRGAAESRGKATSRNRVGRVWDADAESNGQDNSVKKNRKGSSGGSNNNTWRGLARLASCILGPKRSEEVVKKIVRDHPALQEKLAKGRARSGKASSRSRKPRELKKPDLITNGMTREHLLCVCVEAFGKPVFDSVVKPVVGRNGWGHNKEMILMAQILTKCWQWTRPMTETEAQSCFVRPGNQQIETTMQFREWNKDRPILTELPPEEQAYKWVYDAEALELPLLQVSLSSSAEEDIFIADTAMTSSHQSGSPRLIPVRDVMMSKPSAPITCSQPPIDVSVGHTGPPSGEMFIKDESMVLGPAMKWDPTSEFADRNDKSQLICKANSLIDKEEIKPPDTWDLCFPCISAEQPKPVFVQEILMNAEYKAPDVISQLSPADKVAGCDIHLGSTIGCPVKSEPIRDVTPYGSPSYGFLGAPALDDDPLEHCSFVSSQWYLD